MFVGIMGVAAEATSVTGVICGSSRVSASASLNSCEGCSNALQAVNASAPDINKSNKSLLFIYGIYYIQ